MICELPPSLRIKWGYATASIPDRPSTVGAATTRLDSDPPRRGDVVLACVEEIGRHTRIDLVDLTKSSLFVGDVLGLTLAPRYATRQFEAVVPGDLEDLHFVCSGGICGRVTGVPSAMLQPTRLRALGYLVRDGERVTTRAHRLPPPATPGPGAPVLVVVGSAMDSGKTTAAVSLANGLTRSGCGVAAAKAVGYTRVGLVTR